MKPPERSTTYLTAFTRIELLAILGSVGILAMLALPALASLRTDQERIWCSNNLRLLGRALHVWGQDHGRRNPWTVPIAEGGSQTGTLRFGQAWHEWSWISNQLVTPRLLACPSDEGKKVATDFSQKANGGFLHFSYRDNAVSYWLGTDAGSPVAPEPSGVENTPTNLLAGDRNIAFSAYGQPCRIGFNNVAVISAFGPSDWTNAIHGLAGNILLNDGQVLQLGNAQLRWQEYIAHVLPPN